MCDSVPSPGRSSEQQPPSTFFQAVVESLVDGIIILSDRGEPIYLNSRANALCQQLLPESSHPSGLAQEVWRLCQAAIEGRELFPQQNLTIESELVTTDLFPLRLRARWFQWDESQCPYLLVTLEERSGPFAHQASDETQKYGLTAREAQVWLLRRARYSYKEIAVQLRISEHTVKKHMKNVNIKRKNALWLENNGQDRSP